MDQQGRVDIRYRDQEGARIYRAASSNLKLCEAEPPRAQAEPGTEARPAQMESGSEARPAQVEPGSEARPAQVEPGSETHADGAILVYTDGACSGNPGPMGVGVVVLDRGQRRELGQYLGEGTNNIAELTAVERALDLLPESERERTINLHIDSSYAIGVLAKGWKARANTDLVDRLRRKLRKWPRLRFVKVEGHAGVKENERCDELARQAIRRGAGRG